MTNQTFEYKTLRFLNDRFERYDITDHSLRIALYDFPENEYNQGLDILRNAGYVTNKDLYGLGLSITEQGKIRLQQLQTIVDREKKQAKTFWEKASPIIAAAGTIAAIVFGLLTLANDKKITNLETEAKTLNNTISLFRDENKMLKDSISLLYLERKNEHQKRDSVVR